MAPPSRGAADHQATPLFLNSNQYVSLVLQHNITWQVGHLFTKDEFIGAYKQLTAPGELGGNWVAADDVAVLADLFHTTKGHPGARPRYWSPLQSTRSVL